MSSHSKSIQLVASFKDTIRELVGPIERIQLRIHDEEGGSEPNGLELLAGELTMVVLIFTNADLSITNDETDLLNSFRQAVCGDDSFTRAPDDYADMCRRFLRIHPNSRFSIDHPPSAVRYLDIYDREHGTEYAKKARDIFFKLASAIVQADEIEKPQEMITLLNFKEILYSPSLPTSAL